METITTKSIGIDGTVFEERRAVLRQRVFKGGRLVFNRGYGAMECVVRNMSEQGARLKFGDASGVPFTFELRISGDDRPRTARVRWRGLTDVGVSFDMVEMPRA